MEVRRLAARGAIVMALDLIALVASSCAEPLTPQRLEALLEEGDEALQAGRLQDAEKAFLEVSRADPRNGRAAFGMGLSRLRLGDPGGALSSFDSALAAEPGHRDYAYFRAHCLAKLGRRDEAIRALDELLTEDPSHAQAATDLVDLLREAGRGDQAAQVAEVAAERSPRDASLQLPAGRALGAAGRHVEALVAYQRARRLRSYDTAPVYGQIEALRGLGRVDESLQLMKVFEDLQAREKDVEALRQAAAAASGEPGPARHYIERLFQEGRLEEGVAQTSTFLSQFSGASEGGSLATRAAVASLQLGDQESARRFLGTARVLGERTDEELLILAQAESLLGEYEQALPLYEVYLERNPEDARALLGLGRAAMRTGSLAQGETALRHVLSIQPKDPAALALMGQLLIKRESRGEALTYLKRSLKEDPTNVEALFGMGFLAQQERDAPRAEEYLRKTLAADPGHSTAQAVLAILLAGQRRCAEAIPFFVEALKGDLKNMALHAGLIQCYEQEGRFGEAEEARGRAQQILGVSE